MYIGNTDTNCPDVTKSMESLNISVQESIKHCFHELVKTPDLSSVSLKNCIHFC